MYHIDSKNTKRVLILGVGSAQLDAIIHCKNLGWEVFGVSYLKEGQGIAVLDHFEQIDIIDKDRVLDYAKRIDCDLIYSVGSDIAMPTVSYVAEKLKLPFYTPTQLSTNLGNKGWLRKFLNKNKISTMEFKVSKRVQDFAEWKIFPAIIKPVDSQGQRGIYKVHKSEDITHFFHLSQSVSRCGDVIIEQYIDGPELSVNVFITDSVMSHIFITDRFVVQNDSEGLVSGHGIPAGISDTLNEKIRDLISKTVNTLGIQNGPVYFQLKYSTDDLFIIEVTARLDGCHLWKLIQFKYGINLLDLCFRTLLTIPHSLPPDDNKSTFRYASPLRLDFFLQQPGTSCQVNENSTSDSDILYQQWYYDEGETIRPVNGCWEKVGYKIRVV